MDYPSVAKLLTKISINYPRFKSEIATPNGTNIRKEVIEEWHRQIGFLDLDEALERLDLYMEDANNKKAPMAMDFRKYKPRTQSEEWHSPEKHQWHLDFPRWDSARMHGRLYDQEDREYVHDPTYEDGYHYDRQGHICTIDGRVVMN